MTLLEPIELAELGPAVLAASDDAVSAARERVAGSRILIVATPVYKGSYTGLLKAFLDGYGPTSLSGVSAIPLVVAGSPAHTSVAADIHLRPLLHELGAQTPFGTLALLEADIAGEERDGFLASWVAERVALFRAVASGRSEEVAA
ncbi:hypothetical protein GCM10027408_34400 [Microbacterium tumbae]